MAQVRRGLHRAPRRGQGLRPGNQSRARSLAPVHGPASCGVYAREQVAQLWFVDPEAQTLEVLSLDGATYRLIHTFSDDALVRAEPFDQVELELGWLWGMRSA